ncbi:MAG: Ig-like domain-containing protein [Myxococcaceae bacterium]|nr:Ig-like domain-containing protein [Myxococcaceae bacterium]
MSLLRRALGVAALALAACSPAPECTAGQSCAADGGFIRLKGTVPAAGATVVPLDTALELQFSQSVQPQTLAVAISPDVALGPAQWNAAQDTVRFTPPMPLAPLTRYAVVASGEGNGGARLMQVQFSFTTRAGVDLSPPVLSQSSPANGASAVPWQAPVTLSFDKPMDEASVAVTISPPLPLGALTWPSKERTLAFAMHQPFDAGVTYRVTVTAAKSLAGTSQAAPQQVEFTTALAPDTTAPTVVGFLPALDDAGLAPSTSPLAADFSEPMGLATQAAVRLQLADGGATGIPCAFALDPARQRVGCTPVGGLAFDTAYQLVVSTTAVDLAGNALAAPALWPFRTVPPPDLTPPTVVSFFPDAGAAAVPGDVVLEVGFSEPMEPLATAAAFFPAAQVRWNDAGTHLWATAPGDFAADAGIAWGFGDGGRDLSGNPLAPQAFGFFVAHRETQRWPADPTSSEAWVLDADGGTVASSTVPAGFSVGLQRDLDGGLGGDRVLRARLVFGVPAGLPPRVLRVVRADFRAAEQRLEGLDPEVQARPVRDGGFDPACVAAPCAVPLDAGFAAVVRGCLERARAAGEPCALQLASLHEDAGEARVVSFLSAGADGGPELEVTVETP